ncbi:hypothetical protein GQX73_g10088 [Xylaria multiplex]|uniref:Uncharacterized protein n=1 Tax=Xylaria multiplex TaxID=323545 RepID=A0A7C8ILM8_9PEZI|nr:hypothetical protein GQX73_g10088 [Xylaria multiplex]
MAPPTPSTLRSLDEIQSWLNTTCESTNVDHFIEGAQAYCVYLVKQFTETKNPSMEEFIYVTDSWVQTIAERDIKWPLRVEFILSMCAMCFDDTWIMRYMGPTLQSLGGETSSGTGRSLLFAYLVWRYNTKAKELWEFNSLSETIENLDVKDGCSPQ